MKKHLLLVVLAEIIFFSNAHFIGTITSAANLSTQFSKGRVDKSRIVQVKGEMEVVPVEDETPIVLLAGCPFPTDNLNEYRLYNVENSLKKSLPFLQIKIAECLTGNSNKSHFLKGFPLELSSLSYYAAIILIDIPAWALTNVQDNLISYVKNGGTLIFVGDHARGYKETKLRELIPLEFDYTSEVEGHKGTILKDKSSFRHPQVVDKNHFIIRGLPVDIPEIVVHQSSVKKGGHVIVTAGDLPLLAEWKYGEGQVISFPISLTDQVIPASWKPDGDVPYKFWDDKLIKWDFYDEFWRNMILYSINKSPRVDFSGLTTPGKTITYPNSIDITLQITNFSTSARNGSICFSLYKNNIQIRKETIRYMLRPEENKVLYYKVKLDYPRGKYCYRVDIKNKKGDVITYRDGSFNSLPETYLNVAIPLIPVFGRNSKVDLTIQTCNLKEKKNYRTKTSLIDFRGDKIEELPYKEINGQNETRQNLPIRNLMKGDYKIVTELQEDEKTIDVTENEIYIIPSQKEEDIYPNVILNVEIYDKEQILKDIKDAKELGFNGFQIYNWAGYKRDNHDLYSSRALFYAFQEVQKSDMIFCPHSTYGQNSWNRWYKGCPNTIITQDIEKEDAADIKDFVLLYGQAPRYFATYVADEPGVDQHNWKECPVCQKAFRNTYGYEMPTDIKDKNYYMAYKFICAKNVEALERAKTFVARYSPEFKFYACLNQYRSLWDSINAVGTVSHLDVAAVDHYRYGQDPYCLDLLWGASNFKNNIWLLPTTSIISWGTYDPEYIGTQVYNALCHNAKGLSWYIWKQGCYDTREDPERVQYCKKVFTELNEIGPLFKYLTKGRAKVAMLHSWTNALLNSRKERSAQQKVLFNFHTLLRQSFGMIDIIHEDQIMENKFLPNYHVLVLPSIAYLPEDIMVKIKEWVRSGGLLIVFPETALYNERQEKSHTLSEIFGATYDRGITSQVKGVETEPSSGYILNSKGSSVLYQYDSGESAITENNYGKGRVLCFGFVPKEKEILESVTTEVDTTLIKSINKNVDVSLFPDQNYYYLVAVNQQRQKQTTDILVDLPQRNYYIYDLLTGEAIKYSYQTNKLIIPITLESLWGKTLVIFTDNPVEIRLKLDKKSYRRGEEVLYTIELLNKEGRGIKCKLPVNISIIDSEGTIRREYGGTRVLTDGYFAKKVLLADNEPKGNWSLIVREKITGKEIKSTFMVN